jgi:uncharacterized protein YkwD
MSLMLTAPLALSVLAPVAAPRAAASGDYSQEFSTAFAQKIARIVNTKRVNRGKEPLVVRVCVDDYAQAWGAHLAKSDGFEHSDLYDLVDQCDLSAAAENLVRYADGYTAREVVALWMASEGHRHNIMNSRYRQTGIAVIWDANQEKWYAVQNFGKR